MTTYEVTDPDSGKSISLDLDHTPTESEIKGAFDKMPKESRGEGVGFDPRTGLPSTAGNKLEQTGKKMASMGVRAGLPAAGQTLGAMTGFAAPVMTPFLGGALGLSGELLGNYIEGNPNTIGGAISATALGALPVIGPETIAAKAVAKAAVKQGAANLAAAEAKSVLDKDKALPVKDAVSEFLGGAAGPTVFHGLQRALGGGIHAAPLSDAEALNEMRDQVYRSVRQYGVVVPPHEMGKGMDVVSSLAGKAASSQQASAANQGAWQKMAREDVKLSAKAIPIRRKELDEVRDAAAEPYIQIEQIASQAKTRLEALKKGSLTEAGGHGLAVQEEAIKDAMNPLVVQAAADVKMLRPAREHLSGVIDDFHNGTVTYDAVKKAEASVERIENSLESAAVAAGDPKLVNRLRESRRLIAKTYAIQKNLNPGSGFVDPAGFGRMLLNESKLDGNLLKIAEFQLAFRRSAVEASKSGVAGANSLNTGFAAMSAAQGNPAGGFVAGMQALGGKPFRSYQLGEYAQNKYAQPRMESDTATTFASQLGRFATMQNAPKFDPSMLMNYSKENKQ